MAPRRQRRSIRREYRRAVLTPREYAMGDEGVPPREVRLARLRRLLPASVQEIVDAYPEVWSLDRNLRSRCRSAAAQRLYRDLRAIGARYDAGIWRLED